MYKKALKNHLRFESPRGELVTEDLFMLPLKELNELAKKYNRKIKENEEADFLKEKSERETFDDLRFQILLDIIQTKLEDAETRENRAIATQKKNKLLEILQEKEIEHFKSLSPDELRKEIEKL